MIDPLRGAPGVAGRTGFARARALIAAAAQPLGSERIALADAAQRVIATSHRATADLVPFARSAMDGYAVRSIDTRSAAGEAVLLPIAGAAYAGDTPQAHRPHSATAIATGAPLPAGADAVVPFERVVRSGTSIRLDTPLVAGQHVFPPGDDAAQGDELAGWGDVVTPGRAALLAAGGHARLHVFRRPRVAIVCSGDEIVNVDERPALGQVRNSNATLLAANVLRDGGDVVFCAAVSDSADELRAVLARAVQQSDLVITTGGASVGERDLMKATFAALGARFAFDTVALRPGRPTAFGRCGDALVAVLPGNPAAAFVAYATLVRGAVRRCAGRRDPFAPLICAVLDGSIQAKAERHLVVFANASHRAGTFYVEPLRNQCSSLVMTSAIANALVIVPPGPADLAGGALVDVEVLDWDAIAFGR